MLHLNQPLNFLKDRIYILFPSTFPGINNLWFSCCCLFIICLSFIVSVFWKFLLRHSFSLSLAVFLFLSPFFFYNTKFRKIICSWKVIFRVLGPFPAAHLEDLCFLLCLNNMLLFVVIWYFLCSFSVLIARKVYLFYLTALFVYQWSCLVKITVSLPIFILLIFFYPFVIILLFSDKHSFSMIDVYVK